MASYSSQPDDIDFRVRTALFDWLAEKTEQYGEVLDWKLLCEGIRFRETRVPVIGQQGIFKPAILPEIPLSIRTAPEKPGMPRPYADGFDYDGRLKYKYRGDDPQHPENRGLRAAMNRQAPLVYLFGIVPGRYLPQWPVHVVADNPRELCFTVDLSGSRAYQTLTAAMAELPEDERRRYATVSIKQRLHQTGFRERVLRAYKEECALCRLKHAELLEAAHILPDSHPLGEPTVRNGLALCKLHHAAYDRNILGIRPDLKVEIRFDILNEEDGPMLQWGLQHFHGARVRAPRSTAQRPNPEFLRERYDIFRKA